MASQHPGPTLLLLPPMPWGDFVKTAKDWQDKGYAEVWPILRCKVLKDHCEYMNNEPKWDLCQSQVVLLNGPSILGKMVYNHFAPVTGNKIIDVQERIQSREYCRMGSMTGTQWKFGEQSDDLASRWVSSLSVTPNKPSSTSLLTFFSQVFL